MAMEPLTTVSVERDSQGCRELDDFLDTEETEL
jgi:hypothetical protein